MSAISMGYKQTALGVIPEDWRVTNLESLSAFITKGSTPTTYGFKWEPTGILFLRSECVSEDGLDLTQSMFISPTAHSTLRRSAVGDGDILVTITGNVGRVVRLSGGVEANLNQHIARVRITSEDADGLYVYHFLVQPVTRRRFNSITTGQAYPQISLKQVREAAIPLPPLPEQRAIATALSDVDALLDGLTQLIAKKRDLKQAAMQQLLTGQTRLPGFSGGWEVKQLGEVGTFLKGSGVKKDQAQSGDLPCIRYGEIYTHHNDCIKSFNSWISREVATTATRLRQGDLLFAGSGETKEEIGKCVAFVDDCEAYAGGDIVILRPSGIDPVFMGYYCNTSPISAQKASKGQGDAVVHISAHALSSIVMKLPTLAEQTAIAAILLDMDTELAALEARLTKTRALKQAMMSELLTGKTRLPTA